jgi:hypothetical protein
VSQPPAGRKGKLKKGDVDINTVARDVI